METPRRSLRNLPKVDYTLTGLRTVSSSTTASSSTSNASPKKSPKPRPSTPYGSALRKSRTRRSPVPEVVSDDDYGAPHLSEITAASLNRNNNNSNSAIRSRFPAKGKNVNAESPPRGLFDRLQIGSTDSPIHLGGRLSMRNSIATFSPSRLFWPSTPLKPATGFDEEFEGVRVVEDDGDFVVYDDEEEEEEDNYFEDPDWREEDEGADDGDSESETEVERDWHVAPERDPKTRIADDEVEETAVEAEGGFQPPTFTQDQLWSTIASFLWLLIMFVYSSGVALLGIFFRMARLVIELAVKNSASVAPRMGPKAISLFRSVMQSLVRPCALRARGMANLAVSAIKDTADLLSRTTSRLANSISEVSTRMAKSALSLCNASDPAKLVRMVIGFVLLVMMASMLLHTRGASRPSPQIERTILGPLARLKLTLQELRWPSIHLPKISESPQSHLPKISESVQSHPDQESRSTVTPSSESFIPVVTPTEPEEKQSESKQQIRNAPAPKFSRISKLEKAFADFQATESLTGNNERLRFVLDGFLKELYSVKSDMKDISVGTLQANREIDEKFARVFSMMNEFRRKLENQQERVAGMVEEQIRSLIPQYMVARVDPKSGKVELEPSFYEFLKTTVSESQSKIPSESRDAFVQSNSKAVSSLIDVRVTNSLDAMARNGKIISRDETISIIRQNLRQIMEEHSPIPIRGGDNEGSSGSVLSTEESVAKLVKKLVDGALRRYQTETQSLVDYALVSNGARVISSATSETYHPPRPKTNWINHVLTYLTGVSPTRRGKPPTTALTSDVHVGNCWPLAGSSGHLTVQISKPIHPTDFTIDHVPPSPSSDPTSTPKEIEVWAAYKRKELSPESLPPNQSVYSDDPSSLNKRHQSLKTDYVYFYLASHVFDVRDGKTSQTFPVNVSAKPLLRKLPPVHTVQLRIASNHGNEKYTCVYRFRVHGKPADDPSLE